MSKWIMIKDRLPNEKERVELKRDFTCGIGGFTGHEKFEWQSNGFYRYKNDLVIWSIKSTEGLTFTNSKPTHWRKIKN